MYNSEKEMYPEVFNWLLKHLKGIYPKSEIEVFDTSKINLCEFIRRKNLSIYFSEFETYVIKVDITGVIKYKEKCLLAFVECKLNLISLKDISQLIGYSKVVRPTFSLILSPAGISSPVNKLINIYKRYDILTYWDTLNVRIAKWNRITKEIDQASLLPHGSYY
jgi:hypothetical protein